MAATILIADDDAVQRRLVENMVQKCGYEPLVVESGDAAVALLTAPDAQAIDAVVLDLVMPGLDGLGVLAKIREAGLNIPVIVQTAHGGIDNVVSAMRAGAQDFVVKPVGFERLQVSLRNALNTSRAQGRIAAHPPQPRRPADFCRHHHPQRSHGGRAAHRAEGGRLHHSGAGRRRIRRRQGTVRPRHPRHRRTQVQALRRGQLRRDPRQSRGIDPVRSREGRLHRRHRTPYGQVRRSLRRHAVSRRGRRVAAGRAGKTAARAAGRHGRGGRRPQAGQGRRPHHLRDQPQAARPREERRSSAKTCSIACTCCR